MQFPPQAKRAWPYLLCFALGFGTSEALQKEPEPLVIETTTERVVEAKKEVKTTRQVVTKVTKPDGTVIERREDKAQVAQTTVREAQTARQTLSLPAPSKTSYSLGLRYLPSLTAPPSWRDTAVEFGARLGQSNTWGTVGYDVKYNQVSIGIKYEW